MKGINKIYAILILLVFCNIAKGQDSLYTVNNQNKYSVKVENGDTIYNLIPQVWDLNPKTAKVVDTTKKASTKASKVSAYIGDNMDLSHIPESFAVDKSKDIGEIPIVQNSANGSLSYSVPIEAYQVASGMNPSIQIAYNSMSGNGIAGYGWQIGGLSAISVANSSIYFDGNPAPAKADNTGTFELNGQRLIKMDYTSTMINYQTEQGNIKVTANVSGSIIKYFQVYYPNGNIATYGFTTNTTAKISYPISSITDLSGNKIDFSYTESNNVYCLNEINYGGRNAPNSRANYAKIGFTYENRNDFTPVYMAGVKMQQDKRLKEIKCYFNNNLLRTYSLTYIDGNSSMLNQIDCVSNNRSLNPLRFYYGENNQLASLIQNNIYLGTYFTNASAPNLILSKGKFEQNSTNDGLISYPNFSTYGVQVIKKNFWGTITGYQYGSTYSPNQSLLVYGSLPSYFSEPSTLTTGNGFISLNAMDIDGDGKDELVKINTTGVSSTEETVTYNVYDLITSIYSLKPTASLRNSFSTKWGGVVNWDGLYSPAYRAYLVGDFEGNGVQNVLTIRYNKNIKGENVQSDYNIIQCNYGTKKLGSDKSCFSLNPSDQIFVIDFDGDGKADICRKTSSATEIYTFNPATNNLDKIAQYGSIDVNNRKMLLGDMNGDGKTDIAVSPQQGYWQPGYEIACGYCDDCVYGTGNGCQNPTYTDPIYQPGGNTWNVYYSTGTSSGFDLQTMSSSAFDSDDKLVLQDMNGDSKPDLVVNNNGTIRLYPNINGKISETPESQTISVTGGKDAFLIAGNVETGYRMSQLFSIYDYHLDAITFTKNVVSEQLLTGMITSTGVVSKNQYGNIMDGYNIYDKGTACTYPYRNLSGNLFLHVSTEDYLSGNRISAVSRNYTRGMIDISGKGFLGFEQIKTYDEIRNTTTTQIFDPVNFGGLKSVNGPTVSAAYTYSISVTYNKIAKVTLSSKTETDKITNTTVNTSYTYDNYGNPTKEIRDYGGGLKITTESWYNNLTTSPYILGELYQQTITKLRDGLTSTERTYIQDFDTPSRKPLKIFNLKNENQVSEITNLYENGNLTSESRKDFSATTSLSTTYTYDSYGRLSRKTNPLGLYEDYGYDNLGRLSSVTDHKNHSTTMGYDNWGRKISTISPDGVTQTISLQWIGAGTANSGSGYGNAGGIGDEYNKDIRFSTPMTTGIEVVASNSITLSPGYSFAGSAGGNLKLWIDKTAGVSPPVTTSGSSTATEEYMYLVTNRTTGAPATQTYIDALGREIRTGFLRFDGSYLYSDKEYDDYGRVSRTSLPFKGSSPSAWNTYTYDTYDRPLSVVYASGKTDTYSYSELSATSTIDGVSKTITKDAIGNVLTVVDPAGTITYNIRPDGQPNSIVAPGNITTSFEYDVYGRQTKLIDPSAGTKVYVYDAAGNIYSVTDDRGKVTQTLYDGYHRLSQKEIVGELTTSYEYNPDGQLYAISSNNSTGQNLTYDGFMRLSTVKDLAPDGKYLQKEFSYNNGVPVAVNYSNQNGAIATENYSYAYGTQTEIKLNNNTTVWKLTAENNMGLATSALTGNLTREYGYDMYGLPTSRLVKNGTNVIQNFGYNFNTATGNLNWRRDNIRGLQENFGYDNLNRLTTFGGNTITYDIKGNITNHSAVGNFVYGNDTKPYMVTAVTPYGSAIPMRNQDVTYNGMQRPITIAENGYMATFTYDENGQRVKMQLANNGQTQLTRYYVGEQYELDAETGTERLYLGGDAYSAASVYVKEAGIWKIYYICRDYQGSITHVVNADGSLKQELSYDPWGRLRNPATQQVYAVGSEPTLFLARGYTGHEHLTQFGLINMNARLYDAALGRFLSPDPYVQSPEDSQNFNRYSYCLNNPLRYTDTSGEIVWFIPVLIAAGISMIVNYGVQVASNYAAGKEGKEAWINNIDFLDIAISGVLGGISAGASNGLTATSSIGKGLISLAKSQAWKWGSVIGAATITSFFNLTTKGFETNSFSNASGQFLFNLAIAGATNAMGGKVGDWISKTGEIGSLSIKNLANQFSMDFGSKLLQYSFFELTTNFLYNNAIAPIFNPANSQPTIKGTDIPTEYPKKIKRDNENEQQYKNNQINLYLNHKKRYESKNKSEFSALGYNSSMLIY